MRLLILLLRCQAVYLSPRNRHCPTLPLTSDSSTSPPSRISSQKNSLCKSFNISYFAFSAIIFALFFSSLTTVATSVPTRQHFVFGPFRAGQSPFSGDCRRLFSARSFSTIYFNRSSSDALVQAPFQTTDGITVLLSLLTKLFLIRRCLIPRRG